MNKQLNLLCILLAVLLAACAPSAPEQQATEAAIETRAVSTALAQLTQHAQANPSATPTRLPTETALPTATLGPTATPSAVANTCDQMTFRGDITIEDEEEVPPNATFNKIWAVENTGTCDWTTGYRIRYSDGERMSGPNQAPLGSVVAPGDVVHVTVTLRSPSTPGKYTGYWVLTNAAEEPFGYLYIIIRVVAATPSP